MSIKFCNKKPPPVIKTRCIKLGSAENANYILIPCAFRHQANKLLELAMGNTVAKGSTYKDKMNELELEIAKLEDEIDKLQAQKSP